MIGLGDLQAEVGMPPPRVRGRGFGFLARAWAFRQVTPVVVLTHLSSPPVSSISSGNMLAAWWHRVNAARACAGDTPASPQAGVITACSAHVASDSPSRRQNRMTRSAVSRA